MKERAKVFLRFELETSSYKSRFRTNVDINLTYIEIMDIFEQTKQALPKFKKKMYIFLELDT
jgi:hypothetical protein